jgi:ABC-2 type transport system permease protein
MSLTRLFAVIRKETLHILRDRRSLIAAILLPVILMFAYCESLSLDVNNLPMVIMDYDRTPESRDLAGRFISSGYFSIVDYVENYDAMQKAIDDGRAVIGLSIPRDFGKKVRAADKPIPLQVMIDGTDPNRGNIALGYSTLIGQSLSQEIITRRLRNMGIEQNTVPVEGRIRIWFNPALRSKNYLVPALMAMIMAILAALLTSTTISKEWENGTMELLISTPVSAFEIVAGKFIPYFMIGIIDSALIVLMGHFVYQVPIRGSYLLLSFVIVLFIMGMLMIGLLVSCSFRSSLIANQVAFMATYLPTMLLSGFVFFIPGMPKILQYITLIVPARHFITCARGIFSKGVGLDVLYPQILFLLVFDIVLIALTVQSFKKTLDVK